MDSNNNDIDDSKNNKLDIAKIHYRNQVGRFSYDDIDDLNVNDNCIVETDEGLEFATVIGFTKLSNIEKEQITTCASKDENKCCEQKHFDKKENNEKTEGKEKIKQCRNNNKSIYKVLRKCTSEDNEKHLKNKEEEEGAFQICKEKIKKHNLSIKLINTHYYFDKMKLLFEFISETRVDFRELVKDLASHFHTRIELRQIGVRDEAKIFGGCSICGRELCCNLIKSNFETITIKMAKEQNMPLNTTKISGQCGRLMCCIYYEYNTYTDIKKELPRIGDKILFNNEVAVIRDINIISKNFLIETSDRRQIYVKISDFNNKKNNMIVVNAE